jgi:hypothetical protein
VDTVTHFKIMFLNHYTRVSFGLIVKLELLLVIVVVDVHSSHYQCQLLSGVFTVEGKEVAARLLEEERGRA